jgi:hypothetical protein
VRNLSKHTCWFLSLITMALMALPKSMSGQGSSAARSEVVWHWFGDCVASESLVVDVALDGKSVYSSVFPICHQSRADIKPEPQQRILEFRFDAIPRRFRARSSEQVERITADIWEAGNERDAIKLGLSFATAEQVLLNTIHFARAAAASRSEQVRGLVVRTHPVTQVR